MTTSPRSLRDWLADQLAEVRHATVLAVLAPQKPVGVPQLADMPSIDTEPCCEWNHNDPNRIACDRSATVRVQTHLFYFTDRCTMSVLLCESHWNAWRTCWEQMLAVCTWTCPRCRREVRHLHDVIPVVIPL